MILTVNIGNTHITVGGYEQDTLIFCGRLHSDPAATVEEYAIRLVNLLQLYGASPAQIEGGILGSVVPMLSGRVLAALQLLCKARILTVGPGLKSCIKLRLDNPAQLPQIDPAARAPDSVLGKSTSACLQNGFVLGTASLLDGLADRFCAELGAQTAFYATGDLPRSIREACRIPIHYRETLITDGLHRIWLRNRKG